MRHLGSVTTLEAFLFNPHVLSSNLYVLRKMQVPADLWMFFPEFCKVGKHVAEVFAPTRPTDCVLKDMTVDLSDKQSSLLFQV